LIERLILSLASVGIVDVVVVLGHYAEQFKQTLKPHAVRLAMNPEPDRGQVSSQRIGLEYTSNEVDGVLMALADQPLLNSDDLLELIQAFESKVAQVGAVYPKVQGEPGNPVILSQSARQSILSGPMEMGPKQWRQANLNHVFGFETHNKHFITDVDSQEDVQKIRSNFGIELRWPSFIQT
jgi:molybdenum cofactor cytidylyltransferase